MFLVITIGKHNKNTYFKYLFYVYQVWVLSISIEYLNAEEFLFSLFSHKK